ncbi:MAG: T9SS type A sorting domain-containing protein [Flavobacterium sp.]|uniref:3-coathanger stack domain-containing protein n=1 Tax=Flavobacterium sp. TaxID=239 RepID=UPI0022CBD083|nr:3-coathanger stack domain-containing protein [Flavobacterium sp.]MCZ8197335.1 T9SS type A sorting domain-containing protein [Flavobacterium sp.]
MKNLFIIILFLFSKVIFSQDLQNAKWTFPNNYGLDFMTPTPQGFITNLPSTGFYTNPASVSDQQGNLLFYTDGISVIDKNNNIMLNGNGLLGHGNIYSQNVIIIPNPSDINKFFIVTISLDQLFIINDVPTQRHGLRYSEVDMTNGTGIVIAATKNTALPDNNNVLINDNYPINYGKITSAKHSNGIDYWLIAEIGSQIFTYLVTDNDIIYNDTYNSPLPPLLYLTFDINNANGHFTSSIQGPIKISENNDKILIGYSSVNTASQIGALYVGLFNNTTGALSNFEEVYQPQTIDGEVFTLNGAEFSYDGNTIHRVTDEGLYSSSIIFDGSKWEEGSLSYQNMFSRCLQRGIDHKIYFPISSYLNLGVINNPDSSPYDISLFNIGASTPPKTLPPWVQWQSCHRYLITSNPITTSINEERNNWIKTTNLINTSTTVIYHAGDFVELNPGFETQNASKFTAYIQGCTDNTDFVYKNQIDKNLGDSEKVIDRSLIIYPNPSSKLIGLELKNSTFNKVLITSIDGKTVLDKSIENSESFQVDVSNYANGIYIVNVIDKDGQVYNQKLIKN